MRGAIAILPSMSALILIGLSAVLVGAAPEAWVAPSLENVYPDTPVGEAAEVRLHMACGEYAPFQLCLRADGEEGVERIALEAGALHEGIPAPAILRVAYAELDTASPRAHGEGLIRADPLVPFHSAPHEDAIGLAPGTTVALWVAYHTAPETPPGVYRGDIAVGPAQGRMTRIPVTIEVFGFALVPRPSFQALGPLDRDAIRSAYGIEDADLAAWRPIYDALARTRISPSLWEGGSLVALERGERAPHEETLFGAVQSEAAIEADAAALRTHLGYAVPALGMSAINLADASYGVSALPAPFSPTAEDPLELYLKTMGLWLEQQGWLDRAVVLPMRIPERARWQDARDVYFRVYRANRDVRRLMIGAPHPYFERYTDIWAVPPRAFHASAADRLRRGLSLKDAPHWQCTAAEATHTGRASKDVLHAAAPMDACDGSVFTAWSPGEDPRETPVLTLTFDLPVETDGLTLIWPAGFEADALRVHTSHTGQLFGDATVDWEHQRGHGPDGFSLSRGSFKITKTFIALRIAFPGTPEDRPIALAEVWPGKDAVPTPPAEQIDPVALWLCPRWSDFPSLAADAAPVEARALGWVAHALGLEGCTLEAMNRWPAAWAAHKDASPALWPLPGWGQDVLVYPGPDAPLPSLRSERLRDGIEDYSLLRLYAGAVEAGLMAPLEETQWIQREAFPYDLSPTQAVNLAQRIEETRVAIGRRISWVLAHGAEAGDRLRAWIEQTGKPESGPPGEPTGRTAVGE